MPAVRTLQTAPLRILVVDSSHVTSQALSAFLEHHGFTTAYAGPNPNEALTAAKQARIDVALVSRDLGQQEMAGYDLTSQLRSADPSLRIVMILETSDQNSTIRAFRSGARGIFCRTNSLDVLIKCIVRVHEGQVWANGQDLEHLITALQMPLRLVNASGGDLLSRRERDVVQWAAEGLSNREIASRLGLSENTVKNYLFRVFEKLGISSRVELILYAVTQLANAPRNGNRHPSESVDDGALFEWAQEAAKRLVVLQWAVAEMYRDGRGVPRDLEAAYMWFCIAETLSAGVEKAIQAAKLEVECQLHPKQVEAGRRLACEWIQQQHQPVSVPAGTRVSRQA